MAEKEVEALSEQRLQEIRERCELATPGPMIVSVCVSPGTEKGRTTIDALRSGGMGEVVAKLAWHRNGHDLNFFAHARQDIPDLLAELTRSRAALLDYNTIIDDLRAEMVKIEPRTVRIIAGWFGVADSCEGKSPDVAGRVLAETANAYKDSIVDLVVKRAEQAEAALLEVERQRDKYKAALEQHLCPNDLADWLGCIGHEVAYCECCLHDKPNQHTHSRLEAAEHRAAVAEKALREQENRNES